MPIQAPHAAIRQTLATRRPADIKIAIPARSNGWMSHPALWFTRVGVASPILIMSSMTPIMAVADAVAWLRRVGKSDDNNEGNQLLDGKKAKEA